MSDKLQGDIPNLVEKLRSITPEADSLLLELASNHQSSWVIYCVFAQLRTSYPAQAAQAMNKLVGVDGMVSLF
jgi:hypothetical protein